MKHKMAKALLISTMVISSAYGMKRHGEGVDVRDESVLSMSKRHEQNKRDSVSKQMHCCGIQMPPGDVIGAVLVLGFASFLALTDAW